MADNISMRSNGFYEMAFVGELPWHGHGQAVEKGISIDAMRVAAGMDWSAEEQPVSYIYRGDILTFPDKKVICRSDTGAPIAVVGADYCCHQPKQILEYFRDLCEKAGWYIHTAGTLQGGRKLWVMATAGEETEIVKGDRVKTNVLLATSLDGTSRTHGKHCKTRVVCENTIAAAMAESGGRASVSHRSEFDPGLMTRLLADMPEAHASFVAAAQRMADTPINLDAARDILRELFGRPLMEKTVPVVLSAADALFARLMAPTAGAIALPAGDVVKREQRSVARCLELFQGAGMGADHPGSHGTAWGLLQATAEHIDHERGRTVDSRITSAFFGTGSDTKQKAFELLSA